MYACVCTVCESPAVCVHVCVCESSAACAHMCVSSAVCGCVLCSVCARVCVGPLWRVFTHVSVLCGVCSCMCLCVLCGMCSRMCLCVLCGVCACVCVCLPGESRWRQGHRGAVSWSLSALRRARLGFLLLGQGVKKPRQAGPAGASVSTQPGRQLARKLGPRSPRPIGRWRWRAGLISALSGFFCD